MMRVPLLYAINTAVLKSPRLELRPLVPDDARHFSALLGNDGAAIAMLSHMPDPLTVLAAREWIELRTGPGGHVFALRLADGTFRRHERFRRSTRRRAGLRLLDRSTLPRARTGDGGGAGLHRARARPRCSRHGRRDLSRECRLGARSREARLPRGGPGRAELSSARRSPAAHASYPVDSRIPRLIRLQARQRVISANTASNIAGVRRRVFVL